MKISLIGLLVLGISASAFAAEAPGDRYEERLLEAIKNIQSLNHEQALSSTRNLIKQYPLSRLGHMLYADLLLAKAAPLTAIGSGIDNARASRDFQHEIKQRWQHDTSPAHQEMYPENILFVADEQPHVVLVDQQNSRIYVYRNVQGNLKLETDYFITIGLKGYGKQKRGDQKTPIGVYHVTRYIDGQELPDLYGEGAFPINYPNAWDRRKGRTGSGIWIHGTPSHTYNRSPWASDGCIVVSNPDFLHIDDYISHDFHTPVVVAEQVNWISRDEWLRKRREVEQVLSTWLADWESLDHESYRRHYSQTELRANGRNFKSWDRYKRRVNSNKTWINIDYGKLNVFNYPGEQNLILMQFKQRYRSSNLNVESSKELYWRKTDTDWQIVYEGIRKLPPQNKNVATN